MPITMMIELLDGWAGQVMARSFAEEKPAVAAGLIALLRKIPSDVGVYGVTFDDHSEPRAEEVEKAAQTVVIIRIRLC